MQNPRMRAARPSNVEERTSVRPDPRARDADLPYAWKLPPERLVDGARETDGLERREWCAMIATSPEARAELDLIAAFEEDLDGAPRGRGLAMRLDVAIEGALATLDDES